MDYKRKKERNNVLKKGRIPQKNQVIQGTETAVNENEASVQETANTVTGEDSEDTQLPNG
jgi:hypothetical protein